MPDKWRAAAKTAVRKASRAVGYDIVPVAAGFIDTQRRLLRASDLVVDVGANVGQFAERVRDLGYAGEVMSFEPGTAAYAILRNKAARSTGRWTVRNVALGADCGVATLRVAANSVSSSLLEVGRVHVAAAPRSVQVESESVTVSTLDDELGGHPAERLYVKLDVQGFELPVLSGATDTLRRVSAVQTEMSFEDLYTGQTDWLELCRLMHEAGFRVHYVEPGYEDRHSGAMLQADFVFCPRSAPPTLNLTTSDRGAKRS